MYCKNCGRQLKEGMRFCDRCGQSVRKNNSSNKRREIEELKTERLNRKKRLAEKEAKQSRNKRKKNGGGVFVFIIVIILIAILSVIVGFNIFSSDDTLNQKTSETTPSKTSAAATPAASAQASKSGYSTINIGSVSCPYPSVFHTNQPTGNQKLNLTDSLGGATMIVSQEVKSGAAKDLMLEYAEEAGNVTYSRAGDNWYAITAESDDMINHRKCIIGNGLAVYYDFSYAASSSASSKYEEYISYIDSNFK